MNATITLYRPTKAYTVFPYEYIYTLGWKGQSEDGSIVKHVALDDVIVYEWTFTNRAIAYHVFSQMRQRFSRVQYTELRYALSKSHLDTLAACQNDKMLMREFGDMTDKSNQRYAEGLERTEG